MRSAAVIAAALSLQALGCSGCATKAADSTPPPAEPVDAGAAGSDAGAPASDAKAGAAGNAGHNQDGGSMPCGQAPVSWTQDGGLSCDGTWPGWEALDDDAACPSFRPKAPAQAVPALTWSSCPLASECTLMESPWRVTPSGTSFTPQVHFSKLADGREFLSMSQPIGEDEDGKSRVVTAIYDLAQGGVAKAAWASGCGQRSTVHGLWRDQALVSTLGKNVSDYSEELWLWWAPVESVGALSKPTLLTSTGSIGGAFGYATIGDGIIGWQAGYMLWSEKVPHPLGVKAFEPRFAGKDLFFINANSSDWEVWVRRAADGSMGPLIASKGVQITGFDTDGKQMAWYQLTQPTPGNIGHFDHWELWTAPFTTSPGDLAPVKLADLPVGQGGLGGQTRVGGGLVGVDMVTPPRLYRLSDGGYLLPSPTPAESLVFTEMLWLDDQEMVAKMGFGAPAAYRTVVRQKLSAMTVMPPGSP